MKVLQDRLKKLQPSIKLLKDAELCSLLSETVEVILNILQTKWDSDLVVRKAQEELRGTIEHLVSYAAKKHEFKPSKEWTHSNIKKKIVFLYDNQLLGKEIALQALHFYEISSGLSHKNKKFDLSIGLEDKEKKDSRNKSELDLQTYLEYGIDFVEWFLCNYLKESDFRIVLKNPYLGLNSFTEKDKDFFFGRDDDVTKLIELLGTYRLILLLGNSGQGKTSLLQAGLIPKLKEKNWNIEFLRPEENPLENLNKISLKEGSLIIIDQFEELFINTQDKKVHEEFINKLIMFLENKIKLVLALRYDFTHYLTGYKIIQGKINDTKLSFTHHLSHLDGDNLKAIIIKPAEKLKVTFQEKLVERIIQDLLSIDSNKEMVVNLPLLQFALRELWEEQLPSEGMQLTHSSYGSVGDSNTGNPNVGAIKKALVKYANDVFNELDNSLENRQRLINIFLLLVEKTENGYTRKIINKQKLELYWDLIDKLANRRLVIISNEKDKLQTKVEFVHDALLQHWTTLHQQLGKYDDFLNWKKGLEQEVQNWEKSGCPESALRIDDSWINISSKMLKEYSTLLNDEQKNYINQCVNLRETKKREKELFKKIQEEKYVAENLLLKQEIESKHQKELLLEKELEIKKIQEEKSNTETLLLKQEFESERQLNKEQIRKKQLSFIAVIIIAIFAIYSWFQKEVAEFQKEVAEQKTFEAESSKQQTINQLNETSRQESLRLTELSKQSFNGFQEDIKANAPSERLVQSMLLALESLPENNNRPLVSEAEQNLDHLINAYWEKLLSTLPVSYRNLPAFFDTNFNLSDKKEPILFYKNSGIFIWNNKGQKQFIPTLPAIESVNLSNNGELLAIYFDKAVEIWEVKTAKKLLTFNTHISDNKIGKISVEFSPDNEHILVKHPDRNFINSVEIWSVYQNKHIYTENGIINQINYKNEGKKLELISFSLAQIKTIDAKTGEFINLYQFLKDDYFIVINYSSLDHKKDLRIWVRPNGNNLNSIYQVKFELWNNISDKSIYQSEWFHSTYPFAKFVGNNNTLLINKKQKIELFNIEKLETISILEEDGFEYSIKDVSHDNNEFLISKNKKLENQQDKMEEIIVLNAVTGEQITHKNTSGYFNGFFDTEGKFIITFELQFLQGINKVNVYDKFDNNFLYSFNLNSFSKGLIKQDSSKMVDNFKKAIGNLSKTYIFYKDHEVKQIAQDLFDAVFKNKTWKVTQDNKPLLEKVLIFDQEKNELSGADSLQVPYPHFESLQDKMAFLRSLLPRQTLTCKERRQFKLSLGQNCLKEIEENKLEENDKHS